MFERGSVTLFHVRGVPVRAHWTLLIILPYLAVVFALQFGAVARLAGVPPESLRGPPLFWGAVIALGLFVSVAIHELAHTLVAMRTGGRVRDVTLMLLGGVSHFERMPQRPRTEALIAVAGPVTSLVLGGLLLLPLYLIPRGAADLRLGLFYLGELNVVLGVFNLLPAFPMDGGRVLRAALVPRLGAGRATEIAANVGSVLALLLGVWGVWTGSFLLLFVAIFVFFGGRLEAHVQRVREALAGLRVADLIMGPAPTIAIDAPISQVLPLVHKSGRLDLIAVDDDGRPVGVVRAIDLARTPAERRSSLTVRDLGDRLQAGTITVAWSLSAAGAIEQAAAAGADRLIVVDTAGGPSPIGLLGVREIEDTIALRLAEQRSPRGRRPTGPMGTSPPFDA